MTPPDLRPEHLRAAARRSFPIFCRGALKTLLPATRLQWNWHLDLIGARLQDVMEGRCRRLIINIPPRYGKSLIASVAFPAFVLGHNPHAEVICASYAQSLSEKMARDTRRLMNTPFYRSCFATELASTRERLSELKTAEGGSRLATSVEGTLTGRGGNFIIIDDALKPSDAPSDTKREHVNGWFDSTVTSRPNNKETDAIVVIMQRLHEDDLAGHLIAQGHWEVLSLPGIAEQPEEWTIDTRITTRTFRRAEGEALHPARESLETIAETRAGMTAYDFAAQYQQRPAPAGGGEIRAEWFRYYDPQDPPAFIRKVQCWDTAATDHARSDYSACITLGEARDRQYYVIDSYRGRLLYPELKRKVRELADLHGVENVVIEKCPTSEALIEELKREGFFKIYPVKPKGTKYERILARTALIEAGRVWLPDQAHWVAGLLHEAVMFPNGHHDDQIDALAYGLQWIADTSGPAYFLWAHAEADRIREERRY